MSPATVSETKPIIDQSKSSLKEIFDGMKSFIPVQERIELLKSLLKELQKNEQQLFAALEEDLNKAEFESFATEIGIVYTELRKSINSVKQWSRSKHVPTSILHFPASSKVHYEPFGKVLVISPWNYPILLSLNPIIGAIAAGNSVMLKPSEFSINTSSVLASILHRALPENVCRVVLGDATIAQELLANKFNFIFFTGSTVVGKIIYKKAAEHLCPVVLELGGKSPCIVDENCNINVAAKRIAWGKFLNSGQTCIAPDYILVHQSVKDKFEQALIKQIKALYGKNPLDSKDYCKIINKKHYDRLNALIDPNKVVFGGDSNADTNQIGPTILSPCQFGDQIMQSEIFGPLLPILSFNSIDNCIDVINQRPKPLALYYFGSSKKKQQKIIEQTHSGGVCINDVVSHIANSKMSFGGVGDSGIGSYHGKHSFTTFSHAKAIMTKGSFIDIPIRYAPYHYPLGLLKQLFRWFF